MALRAGDRKPCWRIACAALGAVLLVSLAMAAGPPRQADDTGSPERFAPDLARAVRDAAARPQRKNAAAPAQIRLVFHVLSGAGGEGDLTEATLRAQTAVLNEAYRAAGFEFAIAEIRRYPNSPYFAGGCFPTMESGLRMKEELAADPAHFVNVYFCKLALPYIAGYGTLPDEYPEGDYHHGLVIDYGTVPGSAAPLNLGHTLVHEMGHYLGLLHTFQGGCDEPGDGVADTPAEASASYGCAVGRDTCAAPGADPVTDFMDYSEDACTDHFTPLQNARMQTLRAVYRPSLAGAFAIGPGITGSWFDPAQSGHGLSVEVLPGNQMLADWYVFAPDGGPTWIAASGPISGDTAVLQAFQVSGPGGRFPPNFDATRVQSQLWGTLTLRFDDCQHGQASWQPVVAGYAGGAMPIARLTLPAGLSCP